MKHGSYSNFTFNPVCVCSCVCVCVGGGGGSIKTVVMIQLIMDKIFKKTKKKNASAKSIFHGVEDGIKLMLHLFTAGEIS